MRQHGPGEPHGEAQATAWADIAAAGRGMRLEYHWIAPHRADAPLLVFLHEGLGSLSMWKDWPARACAAAGCRGLVYSRPGYGGSTPRRPGEKWPVSYMHEHARDILPALFKAVGLDACGDRPLLLGHSDGASIALLHASMYPGSVAGVIAMAPHIFVEEVTLRNIEATRQAYLGTGLRARLSKYHDDPDSAFWGWNDIWLDPAFRTWNIEDALPGIACPVLALQGMDDEYATLAQIEGIARQAPHATALALPHCRHSPHRDQPEAVIDAIKDFLHTWSE